MCKQLKIGFTDCPHVYADGDIEPCDAAIEAAKTIHPMHDGNTLCENIEWEWEDERELGYCFWCGQMKDSPKKKRKMKKLMELTAQVKDRVISGSMDEVLDEAIDEAIDEATDEATNDATNEATDEATNETTDEATNETTDEATNEVTDTVMT